MTGQAVVLAVLDQGEFWLDARGDRHLVDEMPAPYAENVVAWLSRRAPRLFGASQAGWVAVLADPEPLADEWLGAADREPWEWLTDRPLVRALMEVAFG